MKPFEYIILFFSFIFTLGLTHLLFAATRMLRHRRELVFSWPHAAWMVAALLSLPINWLSMWDLRDIQDPSLATISLGFLGVICNYFICALVSPDFEEGEGYDMVAFHRREGATYIGVFLFMLVLSIIVNFAAGAALSIQNWAAQNGLLLAMTALPLLALAVRRAWVQLVAPLGMIACMIAFAVIYYPRLTV